MAIVTGDRYLDLLARFVEEHAGSLLDGSLVLKLNPVGLHYVQTRLDAFHELETLRAGAPVDYLRAYIADLGDHRTLEQLRGMLSLLTALKVVSVLPLHARDPSTVTISPFGRLRSLELRGCDLSTSAARGLLELRAVLERLTCHNSADALRHIFVERTVEIQDAPVWSRLTSVSCAFNGVLLMDDSLQLLPEVQFLDLSRNRFEKVTNLHRCMNLKFLDLGFNHLRSISSFNQASSQINKLVLRNNALVSLQGITALTSLESLDLSCNIISNFKEIEAVASLSCLEILFLDGNPLCFAACYRENVFSFFADPNKVLLDGRNIRASETRTVRKIISKRQKKQAVYGLYAPAENITEAQAAKVTMTWKEFKKDSSEAEAGAHTARTKRRISRLASIEDAEPSKSLVPEAGEQDDSSGFHASSSYARDIKEREQDSLDEGDHDKVEVMELMKKIEALKEVWSDSWLQELSVLLEDNDQQQRVRNFEFASENEKLMMHSKLQNLRRRWSRRHRILRRRSSGALSNSQEIEEIVESHLAEGRHVKIQRSDSALDMSEVSEIGQGNEDILLLSNTGYQSGLNVKASSAKTSVNSQLSSAAENSSETEGNVWDGKGCGKGDDLKRGLGYAADEEQTSMDESLSARRVFEEVIRSGGIASTGKSPPQYHEGVLQKRHNLEEELLRLSFESGCEPLSSDSESSEDDCIIMASSSSRSEDSPRNLGDHRIEDLERHPFGYCRNQPSPLPSEMGLEENADLSICDSEESFSNGLNDGKRTQDPSGEQHSVKVRSWPNVLKEEVPEALRTGDLNPACTDDILANAGGGDSETNSAKVEIKSKRNRKNRKARVVVISDEGETSDKKREHEDNMSSLKLSSADASTKLAELPDRAEAIDLLQVNHDVVQVDNNSSLDRAAEVPIVAKFNSFSSGKADAVQSDFASESLVVNKNLASDCTTMADAEEGLGTTYLEKEKSVSLPLADRIASNGNLKDPVEEFFRIRMENSESSELCVQYSKCGCFRLWENSPEERDIYLSLGDKDNLYMLAESSKQLSSVGKADLGLHVVACHKLQDVKKVTVGLGLQALRVDIGHAASYLLVTRNVNVSREILDILRKSSEKNNGHAPCFESWEQKQLRMFEELVLGGARTNVLMYMMPLFCHEDSSGNTWVSRSLFLTSHHIFLCIEDLVHFGVTSEDLIARQHPYFIMEASADIYDLSQVVAGVTEGCVTLNFEKTITRCPILSGPVSIQAKQQAQESSRSLVWKFKGVLEEVALKLVALLRASHMEVALHPLTVKNVF